MRVKANKLLDYFSAVEPLKSITRHSWCSNGRQESVAEHTWRMTLMAVLLEEEFPEVDIKKVMAMCIVHDIGEIDGDIPAFVKKKTDNINELVKFENLIQILPTDLGSRILSLQTEFEKCETEEAKLANALDKLEAIIQHNDADISTWKDLEYDLNLTYGQSQTDYHPFLKVLRQLIKQRTLQKIQMESKR